MADRVILITGGGSGIGKAAAKLFLNDDEIVWILGRDEAKLAAVKEELNNGKHSLRTIVADVADPKQCKKAVDTVVEAEGRLDVLVNSAGVSCAGPTVEMTEELWDQTMDINLKGTFFMCRYAIPALAKTEGSIVNLGSDAGIVGNKELAIYCASKGGVSLLTKALAVELAEQNIRVNAVCPAEVDTPMLDRDVELSGCTREEFDRAYFSVLPQGKNARYIRAEEVAECIRFLAQKGSVDAITGACLNIDFGVTSGY